MLPTVSPAQAVRDQLASIPMIRARYRISRSTLYRWMEAGDFPQPVALLLGRGRGRRLQLYRWAEIRAYIEAGLPTP